VEDNDVLRVPEIFFEDIIGCFGIFTAFCEFSEFIFCTGGLGFLCSKGEVIIFFGFDLIFNK
jgi:hypothetical protein